MKTPFRFLASLLALAFYSGSAQAEITWAQLNQPTYSAPFSFGAGAPVGGTFTISTDGAWSGRAANYISAIAGAPENLGFTAEYLSYTGGTAQLLSISDGGYYGSPTVANFRTTVFDFSGLDGGVLRAGSILLFADVDGRLDTLTGQPLYEFLNLSATGGSGSSILSSWLAIDAVFDGIRDTRNAAAYDNLGPADYNTLGTAGGVHTIQAGIGSQPWTTYTLGPQQPVIAVKLTQDVKSITMSGISANTMAIGVTPEPSSALLVALAGGLMLKRRRKSATV